MKTETTSLTTSVLTSQQTPHYLNVKNNLPLIEIKKYEAWLEEINCPYTYHFGGANSSLLIVEPHLIPAEIIVYNNQYFSVLAISESDIVYAALQIGDSKFWSYYTKEQIILIKHLFGIRTTAQIGDIYHLGPKSIEIKIKEILAITRIKYPCEIITNRLEFRILGTALGVYIPVKCINCYHLI